LEKSNEQYRVLYDVKGRFVLKSLKEEEAKVIKRLRYKKSQ
jgi:ribosomal protein S4E